MIPRPATAERGGPPPWRPRTGITLDVVLDALGRAGRLLDRASASATAPDPVPVPVAEPGAVVVTPSAVLIALFEEDGEARVVLTRRSVELRTHRGQVSFPGGRIEAGEDALGAAVREAHEEIGLDPGLVRPVATLAPTAAFATGTPITPVVATLGLRPDLAANPAEVERAFDASLAELAASYWEERWRQPGRPTYSVHFFEVAGETVWGATARMLVELLTVVLADS